MKTLFKILILNILIWAPLQAEVKHFETLDAAVKTFIKALEQGDKNMLEALLTKAYQDIVDEKELTKKDVQMFLEKFKASHSLLTHDDREIYIGVGEGGWTFPIPLVESKNGWYYDFNIGLENIKTRVIGRNELSVIEALQAGIEFEILKESTLAESYLFLKPLDLSLDIVALPKAYGKSAIMSFARTKEGKVLEADLAGNVFHFSEAFKVVQPDYLTL